MRLQVWLSGTLLLLTVTTAMASAPNFTAAPPTKARVVNVTADSAPGWTPTVAQSQAASAQVLAYLAAKDEGRTEAAFAMLDEGDKTTQTYEHFSHDLLEFNKSAGAIVERRIVNVAWTKDPTEAPKPGVYAAIDIVSRFAKISHDCGYIVVYQPPSGGPFHVMREESNIMTDAEAAAIERDQSKAAAEAAWAQLSRRCPNYPGYEPAISTSPIPERDGELGYPTVAAALANIRLKPGVEFKAEGGYTVATDSATRTIWVFTSEGQPAYPAAIKRQIIDERAGGSSMQMSVLCEASKVECDRLVRTFETLNARMAAELKR